MNLKRIELIHNQSTQIDSLIFQKLTQLEELSLFSNRLISYELKLVVDDAYTDCGNSPGNHLIAAK